MKLWLLASAAFVLAACTGASEGAGSNTNWLTCETNADCPTGAVCVARSCSEVEGEACQSGAVVALESSSQALDARQGSYFADAMYEPVFLDDEPSDWVDPITPAMISALVTDADGAPIPGCSVRWLPDQNSGWVFPQTLYSGADGRIQARWIAGSAELQTLTVALIDNDGSASSARLTGHALPHDPLTVQPTLPYLLAPLSAEADALRVRVRPLTAPHHSFYVTSLPDFFTGLQNTSDLDAFDSNVPDDQRLLIASVWHREEGDAEQLWAAVDVNCVPHDQDLGGIRCELQGAWQAGDSKDIVVELRHLASGEAAPPEYADLGYAEIPCASAAGCTDYSVFIADTDGEPRRLAALRIQSGARPGSFSSYIDAYDASDSQTSCLLTPLYRVAYALAERVAGSYVPILETSYSASYQLWANQICANHGAIAENEAFILSTGGPDVPTAPVLPGDPAAAVSLPEP